MNNRLAIALVLFVALLGLVVWQMNAHEAEVAPTTAGQPSLPELDKDKIDELELSAPEKETVVLRKQGEQWQLAKPMEAAADQSAVETALTKLSELEVTGVAATNNKNHDRLEVDEKGGTHVIARAGDKELLDIYIGRYQSGNSMVRLEGQDQVATVSGSIRFAFNKEVRQWRDRSISSVEADQVSEVVYDNEHGRFHFKRGADGFERVLQGGDKPIEGFDPSTVQGLVGSAAKLSATDFAAKDVTVEQAGLGEEPKATLTLTLKADADAGTSEPREIVYRIGEKKENNFYLMKEGDQRIFLISSWVAGRLTPKKDDFIKKETDQAAAQPPGAHNIPGLPEGIKLPPGAQVVGSRQNPIPVHPKRVEPGKKPGAAKQGKKPAE